LLDVQATTRPVRTWSLASLIVAVSCWVGVIPSTRLADGGLTVTLATDTGFTLITGVETLGADSLLAVTIAVPTPAAVTVIVAPLAELTMLEALTARIAGLLETQFTVRPISVVPPASFGVAVSCWDSPSTIGVLAEERVSDATGTGMTVSDALPLFPSLVAMMLALPAVAAVIRPLVDTVATAALSDDQTMARPISGMPLASRVVAVACVACPAATEPDANITDTEATGTAVTVIEAPLFFPSLVAVICAAPGETAVMTPLCETVATDGASEVQLTARSLRTFPPASFSTALA